MDKGLSHSPLSDGHPRIALSTSWLSHRHQDGYAMLSEVAEWGFSYVELSHGIRSILVPGILKALDESIIKVSSVHNFCPLPQTETKASPNLYQPSSLSSKEQASWLFHTQKTLDFAHRVQAEVVVLHLGSLFFCWSDPSRRIHALAQGRTMEALSKDETYGIYLKKAKEKIALKGKKTIKRVLDSLEKIIPRAERLGIKLGIENRDRMSELPLDQDIPKLLEQLPRDVCGYWHDSGHAAIKEICGICSHHQILEENRDRLLGFHLKDARADGIENLALGKGVIDFEMIRNYIRPEHIIVLEVSPTLAREDMVHSLHFIRNLLIEKT